MGAKTGSSIASKHACKHETCQLLLRVRLGQTLRHDKYRDRTNAETRQRDTETVSESEQTLRVRVE